MPRGLFIALAAVLGLGLSACGGSSQTTSHAASASTTTSASATAAAQALSFEGIPLQQGPLLASPSTTQTGKVDGIQCAPSEQLAYHIHAHLAVFDDGRPYALPAGVGIPGSTVVQSTQGPVAAGGQCIYWLHTHAPDGIIHIESPTDRIYTLGNFFDEWHQPLGPDRVADLRGHITTLVNGHPFKGDPRNIQLLPHLLIQLDIGQPTPSLVKINWSGTGL